MTAQLNYKETLARAEKITWRVDDLIGADHQLDFKKPFLPESLARVKELSFLDADQRLVVNQIRGHGYLYTFGLVEEFILPFVMDQTEDQLNDGNDYKTRALLQFACEEAKHIHLFKRFREEFIAGFGCTCDVIGPPEAIAEKILSFHPLAVSFVILGIEWMTQQHYTESVRDDSDLDPQFKSLLKHHWMEEMQHAQLDMALTESLAAKCSRAERDQAADAYLEMGAFLDGGLKQQAEFDAIAFENKTGRTLTDDEREVFVEVQHQAMRWTFLGSGLTHPQTKAMLEKVTPSGAAKIAEVAPAFC